MFQKILFPFDGTPRCLSAVAEVADLAERFRARLTVLHVLREGRYSRTELEEMKIRLGEIFDVHGVAPHPEFRVAEGQVPEVIVDHAKRAGTDLIVLPIRRRGRFPQVLHQSVSRQVVSETSCAVWTLPPAEVGLKPVWSVLCAVSNGSQAQHTVRAAARIAMQLGAGLSLVHAIPEAGVDLLARMSVDPPLLSEEEACRHLRNLALNAGTRASVMASVGPVEKVVSRALKETGAGLLVLGRSRSGLASHSKSLLHKVGRPVLVFPQPADEPAPPVSLVVGSRSAHARLG